MGAGRATLGWLEVTTDEGGGPLTGLAGYRIYRTKTPGGPYTLAADPGLTATPSAPRYTVTDFSSDGVWYFALTAYDASGNESAGKSVEVSKTITRPKLRLGRTYV
jgi:hypothetical protein